MTFKDQATQASAPLPHSPGRRVEWTDRLSVDHPSVDAQHKLIFERSGEVQDLWRRNADRAALRVALDQLHSLLETHFRYEERMLAETAYPKLAEHSVEHRTLLGELAGIRAQLDGDGKAAPEVGTALLDFLHAVTVGHLIGTDSEYCDYVAANPVDELDVSIAAMTI